MTNNRLQGWNPQKTAFTYAKDRESLPGLRSGALYADLGLAEATGGQFHGEIIKPKPGVQKGTTGMHRHDYDLQFNYVLCGEIEFVIEGINDSPGDEKLIFGVGDTYFLPHKILHDETRVSEDFSVMQVYGPAKAATVQVGQGVESGVVSEDWAKMQSKMSEQRLQGWNKQKPAFTYAKDREFGPGLRGANLYADLGLAEGTGGNFHAHLIKVNQEKHTDKHTTGMHRHEYDLQFNYMISGEIDFVIEGIEETLTFRAGDTYFLPTKILHNETRITGNYQVLELYGPAKGGTVQLEPEVD